MIIKNIKSTTQSSGASILKSLSHGVNINLGPLGKFSLSLNNLQRNLCRSFMWLLTNRLVAGYEDENDLLRRRSLIEKYFRAGDSDYALNIIGHVDSTCVTDAMVPGTCEIVDNITARSFNYQTIFTWGYGELGRGERTYLNNTEESFYLSREETIQCLKNILQQCDDIHNDESDEEMMDSLAIAGITVAAIVSVMCLCGCITNACRKLRGTLSSNRVVSDDEEERRLFDEEEQGLLQEPEPERKLQQRKSELKLNFQQRLDRLRQAGFTEEIPDDFLDLVTREIMNAPRVCKDGVTLDKATIQDIIRIAKTSNKIPKCVINRSETIEPTYPNHFAVSIIDNFFSQLEKKYFPREVNQISKNPKHPILRRSFSNNDLWGRKKMPTHESLCQTVRFKKS